MMPYVPETFTDDADEGNLRKQFNCLNALFYILFHLYQRPEGGGDEGKHINKQ